MANHNISTDRYIENISFEVDFPWQTEVIECSANVQALFAGRGSGKTSCVSRAKLLLYALRTLDGEYGFFSPSYEIAKREKNRLVRDKVISANIVDHSNQPTPYITFCSGSTIRYRSTSLEENLLGHHYNGIVLDEVQTHREGLVDNVITPMLSAKRGWLLLMGQFDEAGEDGWLYKRFYLPGQQPNQTRYKSWIIPSSMGFMYSGEQGRAELEAIKASTNPLVFQRQYEAKPCQTANLAFRKEDLQSSKQGSVVDKPKNGTPIIMGVDIGRTVDPTVWVIMQPISKEKALVLNCGSRPLGERYEVQAVEIERVRAVYGARTVILDNTGGGMGGKTTKTLDTDVYTAYFKKGVAHVRPFYFTRKTKTLLMQQLQLAFEQRRIMIPEALTSLHRQLSQFRWELNRGYIDFSGPGGHDDDLVCAFAMCWEACIRGWWSNDATMGASIDSIIT